MKTEYISLSEASRALGLSKSAFSQALINNKILKKIYSIKRKIKTV